MDELDGAGDDAPERVAADLVGQTGPRQRLGRAAGGAARAASVIRDDGPSR